MTLASQYIQLGEPVFRGRRNSFRNRERGVTLLVTAVAMIPLLGMAALAIDLVTLYSASGEAQKAADAGALAGAKAFASSGFTSWQLGDPTAGAAQGQVCNGSTGFADLQAQVAAQQNLIAGAAASSITTACTFTAENPSITVTVTRTGLPTFFARVWGRGTSSASAVAKAEAYNPSGSTTVPVQVLSVKPWLVPNCNPNGAAPPCGGGNRFFFNGAYKLKNPAGPPGTGYIGHFYTFTQINAKTAGGYYALDLPQGTLSCPSTSAAPAGSCSNITSDTYQENIGCSNSSTLSCGDTVSVDPLTGGLSMIGDTTQATQCLIHTTNNGNAPGSCSTDTDPDCFVAGVAGSPVTINGGGSNPNPAMRVTNIGRSDSVVTVPVFDFQNATNDPCPTLACTGTGNPAKVIGFLQLGIQSISASGGIGAVILNATGCDPSSGGNPAVSDNSFSPVPVRLTQ